jgi:hypothetical protein
MAGLLDNFIGNLVLYSAIFDDPTLVELERRGEIGIYHNTGEEFGLLVNPPKVTKKDIVICVDCWCGEVSELKQNYDVSLDNLFGFSSTEITELRECLEWENHLVLFRKFNGSAEDDDESWLWHGRAGKCLTFDIPVKAPDNSWHRDDATISVESILKCRQILKRLICYLR